MLNRIILVLMLLTMSSCAHDQKIREPISIRTATQDEKSVFSVRIYNCRKVMNNRTALIDIFKRACDYSFMEEIGVTIEDNSATASILFAGNNSGCAALVINKDMNTCTVEFYTEEDMCDYMRFVGFFMSEMQALLAESEFDEMFEHDFNQLFKDEEEDYITSSNILR